MTTATVTFAAALTGLAIIAQTATVAEAKEKSFDFQQYVDRYAGSASSEGVSAKLDVEKLAKDLPKLGNLKLRGSADFCDKTKSGDDSDGDWRAIARHYACGK